MGIKQKRYTYICSQNFILSIVIINSKYKKKTLQKYSLATNKVYSLYNEYNINKAYEITKKKKVKINASIINIIPI